LFATGEFSFSSQQKDKKITNRQIMVVGKLLLSHQLKAKSQDYTRYGSQRNSNNIKNNRSVIVANFVHCCGPKIKKKSTKRANYEHTFGQKRTE